MMKIIPLLLLSIFAPSLAWMVVGGQLIYVSQLARHRRLNARARHAPAFAFIRIIR